MSYRLLLNSAPPYFLPLGLAARFPYAMTPLATLLATRSATGSLAFAGLVAAVQSVGMGVSGPVLGALADRFGSRRVGALAAACCALVTLALFVTTTRSTDATDTSGEAVILLFSVLVGLTQPAVGILVRAHWSVTLRRQRLPQVLPTALAWESVADEVSFVAGPALVGVLSFGHAGWAFVLIAGLLLFAALPLALSYEQATPATMTNTATKACRRADATNRIPRVRTAALVLAMACIGTIFGSVQTGLTRVASDNGDPGNAGLLFALLGIGSAASGFAYAWLPARIGWRARYAGSAAGLIAGCALLLAAADGTLPVPVATTIAGLAVSPYLIALFSTAERITPPTRYTTGIAIVCGGGALGSAFGQLIGGVLAQRASSDAFLLALSAATGALTVSAVFTATGRRESHTSQRAGRRVPTKRNGQSTASRR